MIGAGSPLTRQAPGKTGARFTIVCGLSGGVVIVKCWECKKQITTAHRVFYYSPTQEKDAVRDVCPECYGKLTFDPCHYVRVDKITQRSFKTEKPAR